MKKPLALIGLLVTAIVVLAAGPASAEDYGLPNAPVEIQQAFGAFSAALTQAFSGAPADLQNAAAAFVAFFAAFGNLLFGAL